MAAAARTPLKIWRLIVLFPKTTKTPFTADRNRGFWPNLEFATDTLWEDQTASTSYTIIGQGVLHDTHDMPAASDLPDDGSSKRQTV
jgi:hypothetical protein